MRPAAIDPFVYMSVGRAETILISGVDRTRMAMCVLIHGIEPPISAEFLRSAEYEACAIQERLCRCYIPFRYPCRFVPDRPVDRQRRCALPFDANASVGNVAVVAQILAPIGDGPVRLVDGALVDV